MELGLKWLTVLDCLSLICIWENESLILPKHSFLGSILYPNWNRLSEPSRSLQWPTAGSSPTGSGSLFHPHPQYLSDLCPTTLSCIHSISAPWPLCCMHQVQSSLQNFALTLHLTWSSFALNVCPASSFTYSRLLLKNPLSSASFLVTVSITSTSCPLTFYISLPLFSFLPCMI